MNWVKRGCIFAPRGQFSWNRSHAQVPTVDIVNDKVWRIYYSTRDDHQRSRTSYIEVEAGHPENILYEHDAPVLDLGRLGTFDDCGAMASCLVNYRGRKYLYYIGWTVRNTISYHNSIGLAISEDGGKTFRKAFEGPLISTTHTEPYFTGSHFVRIENDVWKMWYLSCTKWEILDGRPEPFYHIKYAESQDGIQWKREGLVAIDYKSEDEGGISKPSVLRDGDLYRMWYSYRKSSGYRERNDASYRIGYAESSDGIHWTRQDSRAGIAPSAEGWDSEMICYPEVISYKSKKFMFYNGNHFGRTGIGYAILNESVR